MNFQALENVDRRVLGAVRFIDATTQMKVADGLQVQSETAMLRLNRAGLFVIWHVSGLQTHEAAFESPPTVPAVGSIPVALTVSDTSSRFLPRSCTLQLPRDPDPGHASLAGSLFQPIDVRLLPAPTAPVLSGWALIRATVKKAGSDSVLPGALILVLKADGSLLARGMSEMRGGTQGEALVAVPGIPVTTFGDGGGGAVISTEIDVTIQTIFDPTATDPPDPDDLEKRKDALPNSSVGQKLASGRVLATDLSVIVP
jgi:hypothetical protein